jgi:hypothetical protein
MDKPEEGHQERYFRANVDGFIEMITVTSKNDVIIEGINYGRLGDFDLNGEWLEQITFSGRKNIDG